MPLTPPVDQALPTGIVLFAHGGGSSRLSPCNVYVAKALQKAHLATLLFDLLTEEEGLDRDNVFDINLLAHRLCETTVWVGDLEPDMQLPAGTGKSNFQIRRGHVQ